MRSDLIPLYFKLREVMGVELLLIMRREERLRGREEWGRGTLGRRECELVDTFPEVGDGRIGEVREDDLGGGDFGEGGGQDEKIMFLKPRVADGASYVKQTAGFELG